MADAPATLSFIPWLRRGLASGITRPDNTPTTETSNAIDVRLNFGLGVAAVDTQLDLVEPGDIAGFDARAVVRTFPGNNESDAEFNHLAMLEFDQADLPWRYTPAAAASDKLRPWMTLLILIDDPAEVTIAAPTPQQKLAQATVPRNKLPDLNEAWAWAHVQVHGQTTAGSVAEAVTGRPGQVVGRLVSPRALLPQTTYLGLVVPTYERGRRAGLGDNPAGAGVLDLAWQNTDPGSVVLPVYYQWRFQTGTSGSFKDLAIALAPRELPATVGRRALDVSRPGLGLPAASTTPLGAEGALQSLKAVQNPPVWDPTEKAAWTTALASVLNTQTVSVPGHPSIKVVVPPLYGRWHAAQGKLVPGSNPPPPTPPPAGSNPPWFFDLNDDPGLRVGAATGTAVVQAHDQDLMASAWQQIGNLKTINDERKVLQVGREAFTFGFDRHVTTGSLGTFLGFTSRLHSHVQFGAGTGTALGALAGSKIPAAVLDPHFRRMSRPLGLIGRRQGLPQLPASATATFFERLNDGTLDPAPEPQPPGGMGTWEGIGGTIIPGNVPDPTIPILTGLLKPKLTFWGLLFFCVARKLLITNPGRKWWWLLRMMRFGLDLLRLAAMQDVILRLLKLRNRTLNAGDVTSAPKAPNFVPGTETTPTSIPVPTFPLPPNAQDNETAAGFRTAFSNLLNVMHFLRPPKPVGATISLTSLVNTVKTALHPKLTLVESMVKRIQFFGFTSAGVRSAGADHAGAGVPPADVGPICATFRTTGSCPGSPMLTADTVGAAGHEPTLHRVVHGRPEPRDGARAAVERVPDRSARDVLPAVLGPARPRPAAERGPRRARRAAQGHQDRPRLAQERAARKQQRAAPLPGRAESPRADGAQRADSPLPQRRRLRVADGERGRDREPPRVLGPPRARRGLLRLRADAQRRDRQPRLVLRAAGAAGRAADEETGGNSGGGLRPRRQRRRSQRCARNDGRAVRSEPD